MIFGDTNSVYLGQLCKMAKSTAKVFSSAKSWIFVKKMAPLCDLVFIATTVLQMEDLRLPFGKRPSSQTFSWVHKTACLSQLCTRMQFTGELMQVKHRLYNQNSLILTHICKCL